MKAREAELRKRYGELAVELRSHLDEHEKNWTAESETRYSAINAELDKTQDAIEREVRMEKSEALANEHPGGHRPNADAPVDEADAARALAQRKELRDFLRGSRGGDYESRALQVDLDESGGYTVPEQEFVPQLIKAIDNLTFVRQRATVLPPITSAQSIGMPSLDADPADGDWTGEITAVTFDTTMDFGKRELHPRPIFKGIKVSETLLRLSPLGIEQLVRDRFAYKFAVTEEQAFLTGTGANQPLGLFTASANGIPTTRDVSTGNTTTAITVDGLIEAQYSVKEGYQRNAEWIFSRTAVKNIRKLKDGDGQYIWAPGLAGGQPATILDKPFHMSEYAPSTFTTGLYVGLYGDLKYYWIADALTLTLKRLNELYALTNQIGFIARLETDGLPVLGEAFARVTLA